METHYGIGRDENHPALKTKLILASAIATAALSTNVHSQAFSSGIDKPVPRLCTNSCAQTNEQLVVDGSGNAVAMWNEPVNNGYGYYDALVGSRFTASTNSWSAPTALWYSYTGVPSGKLEMDAAGNATMLFPSNMGYGYTNYEMYAAKWVAGYGWQTDTATTEYGFEPSSPVASSVGRGGHIFMTYGVNQAYEGYPESRTLLYSPTTRTWTRLYAASGNQFNKIVADPFGSAIGFHHGSDGITTKRFDTATRSWVSLPGAIEYAGYFGITQFQAVSDRSGNVMAIYEKHNYSNNSRELKAARYQASTRRWTAKSLPRISSSRLYGTPSLASDRYGNFYATWVQFSGSYMKTIAARYSGSGGSWSQPVVISRGTYHTRDAAVTTDYAGNAIFTWSQRTDTGTGSSTGKIFRTTAVRYTNATWGTPTIIQDANRNGYRSYIGADNNGRVIVMWTQDSSIFGIKEIRSDRLTPR